jgi:hypothetical protein
MHCENGCIIIYKKGRVTIYFFFKKKKKKKKRGWGANRTNTFANTTNSQNFNNSRPMISIKRTSGTTSQLCIFRAILVFYL